MCGITGLASAPGKAAPDLGRLERMTSLLAHRGPDGQDLWLQGGVGLGHRRLAIIDVAGGDNPLLDEDESVVLVFNGEIYNHALLRGELEAAGCRPRTRSDGEVILHGYKIWGLMGMLRRLRGMYAFALHDRRSGQVHLARDPLGIKPLFHAENQDGLVFGSELKAVLGGLEGTPRLSPRGLLHSVCLGFVLAPHTIYSGVRSLPAGECATWADGRLRLRRHHELVFEPGSEPADPDELWSQITRSVESHLMSEVPLGAFLSGGVDSSTVVTAMAQVAEGGVDAVTVGVGGDGLDEREYARAVAAGLPVRLHEELAEPDVLSLLPKLAWHLEMPFADTSAAPTWLVCEAARRHVTVALSGDGGDENFAGYRRTRYDVLEEQVRRRLPAWLRTGVLGPLGRAWPRHAAIPRPLRAGTLLANLARDWLDSYVHSLSRIPEARARQLLRPEVQDELPLRADFEQHAFCAGGLDPLSRVLFMDMSTWLTDDILVKVDRMSMAHSLEVRVPLLDTDFVEYAARLPNHAKLAGGQGKQLLRRCLRGRVPDSVLDRPKQGFHLPVGSWLAGPAKPALDDLLARPDAAVFELLSHDVLRQAAQDHGAGRRDHATELWQLLVTDAFLSHGPGASPR